MPGRMGYCCVCQGEWGIVVQCGHDVSIACMCCDVHDRGLYQCIAIADESCALLYCIRCVWCALYCDDGAVRPSSKYVGTGKGQVGIGGVRPARSCTVSSLHSLGQGLAKTLPTSGISWICSHKLIHLLAPSATTSLAHASINVTLRLHGAVWRCRLLPIQITNVVSLQ